jgi:hypothetical protein
MRKDECCNDEVRELVFYSSFIVAAFILAVSG